MRSFSLPSHSWVELAVLSGTQWEERALSQKVCLV